MPPDQTRGPAQAPGTIMTPSTQRPSIADSPIKKMLADIVLTNAKRRESLDEGPRLEQIRRNLDLILTDEICRSFLVKMHELQRQLQERELRLETASSNATASVSANAASSAPAPVPTPSTTAQPQPYDTQKLTPKTPATAPKAMANSQLVRNLEMLLADPQKKKAAMDVVALFSASVSTKASSADTTPTGSGTNQPIVNGPSMPPPLARPCTPPGPPPSSASMAILPPWPLVATPDILPSIFASPMQVQNSRAGPSPSPSTNHMQTHSPSASHNHSTSPSRPRSPGPWPSGSNNSYDKPHLPPQDFPSRSRWDEKTKPSRLDTLRQIGRQHPPSPSHASRTYGRKSRSRSRERDRDQDWGRDRERERDNREGSPRYSMRPSLKWKLAHEESLRKGKGRARGMGILSSTSYPSKSPYKSPSSSYHDHKTPKSPVSPTSIRRQFALEDRSRSPPPHIHDERHRRRSYSPLSRDKDIEKDKDKDKLKYTPRNRSRDRAMAFDASPRTIKRRRSYSPRQRERERERERRAGRSKTPPNHSYRKKSRSRERIDGHSRGRSPLRHKGKERATKNETETTTPNGRRVRSSKSSSRSRSRRRSTSMSPERKTMYALPASRSYNNTPHIPSEPRSHRRNNLGYGPGGSSPVSAPQATAAAPPVGNTPVISRPLPSGPSFTRKKLEREHEMGPGKMDLHIREAEEQAEQMRTERPPAPPAPPPPGVVYDFTITHPMNSKSEAHFDMPKEEDRMNVDLPNGSTEASQSQPASVSRSGTEDDMSDGGIFEVKKQKKKKRTKLIVTEQGIVRGPIVEDTTTGIETPEAESGMLVEDGRGVRDVSMVIEQSSSHQDQQGLEEPRLPPMGNVPGIWSGMLIEASESPNVFDCPFEVDEEAARRWGLVNEWVSLFTSQEPIIYLTHFSFIFYSTTYPHHQGPTHICLSLICLPVELALQAMESVSEEARPIDSEERATALSSVKTVWPEKKGSLIVQVNPDRKWGRTWYGDDMVGGNFLVPFLH
jgi:hypothetical protein